MSEKKKILFYTYLASGHFNVCSTVASTLLDKYSHDIEIYFLADEIWADKLSKIDPRFKFKIYKSSKDEEEDHATKTIKKLEPTLDLPYNERTKENFKIFYDNIDDFIFTDEQIMKIINNLKPYFIICDLITQMPSVISSKIPYSFIISCNPLVLDIEDFPTMGFHIKTNEKSKIKDYKVELEDALKDSKKKFCSMFEKMNVNYDKKYSVFVPISEFLSIYCYPKELDYYDEKIKNEYNLTRIDSPLVSSKIPPPYELPEEFAKLPGKIIYVSLGSLFSCYYTKIQKLIDTLATLPYKYIVSKGPNGDKIKFPDNRFIGENFINQLAVLQVVDMMIAHGGNNTFTECFYFGVPALIFPVMFDQLNNAMRVEETGFGYQMDLMNYTQKELSEKINKILSDQSLIEKNRKVGERIRNEKSLDIAVDKLYQCILNLEKK